MGILGKRGGIARYFARVGRGTVVGLRKIKNVTNKITKHTSKAGKVLAIAGRITGQPELAAVGEGVMGASASASAVSNSAFNVSKGIEKVAQGDKSGIGEAFEGGKQLRSQFQG